MRGGRAVGLVAFAACALLSSSPSTSLATPLAAQRALVFEHFDAHVEIQPSGDLIVTETLRPRFSGQWNGIVRHVRLRHTTAAGDPVRFEIELLSASGEGGAALRAEDNRIDRNTRELKVWVPDARDRTAEVVLRYRVRGVIRYFAGTPDATPADDPGADDQARDDSAPDADLAIDYDELYWQVTGTEWDVPIEDASARVVLPPGAAAIRAAAYRGTARSAAPAPVEAASGGTDVSGAREVVVPSSGRLRSGEGLTVAVAWPAGHVAKPPGLARARPVRFGPTGSVLSPGDDQPVALGSASYLALLPLLLPFLIFWLAYRAWDRRGRDPRGRAIAVRWEPPADLTAAEVGTLIDHDPGMHDIISTLVDLAVKGYVVIAERQKKGFLKFGKDYAFHLVRPRAEWAGLTRHEHLFLSGIFAASSKSEVMANLAPEGSFLDGLLETVAGEPASSSAPDGALESVLLSDLQNEFYKKIPAIKDALFDGLVEKGHYLQRPDRVRGKWAGLAVATLALGLLSIPGFATETATGIVFGIAMIAAAGASGVIVGIFAFIMPARTEQGARTREAALGFKRFLERVETPRYRRMITSPDQFERYLPFAMAFRCADKWARAFDDMLKEPPDWYHGHYGAFRPTAFASDLGSMASAASTTMASSPSSSGSGGGGSVGGGSGGGGGGGF